MKRASKPKHEGPAISVKRLSELNTPHVCARCFWLRDKMHGPGRDAPFSMAPAGLLSRMDSLEKRLIKDAASRPAFLHRYKDHRLEVPKRMSFLDDATAITFCG